VFRDLATTGDGTLTGVLLCDLVRRHGRSLAELVRGAMSRLPQVLQNVAAYDPIQVVVAPAVQAAVAAVEAELGERGRVVLRASGTEPLVRIMVEAEDEAVAGAAVEWLCGVVVGAASRTGDSPSQPSGVPRRGDGPAPAGAGP
jgi:phosphoglucosamine mutase